MSNAVTMVPPTYPELTEELYLWLDSDRETLPPPSDDVQFELEVQSMLE